tara:strand:- start:73615 stop:74688 length:1074 start_codon:yes stop_codon:yes gene_type:complete
MAKGLFTQGMCVLMRKPVSIDDLQSRLSSFEVVGRHESMEDVESPETLVMDYRAETGGHLLVTPSNIVWPDDMGDPDESPERFIAWSLGQFGPLAFPGCLQRASEQSWGWEEGAEAIKEHTAHVRLLISYVLGGEDGESDDDDMPLVPDDYDVIDEMKFLTRAVSAVLEMPEAICYFNPGGEVLRDEGGLRRGLNYAWNHELPPLDVWTNVRLFKATDSWSLMDTVGNGQFDLPDLEAVYDTSRYEPADVEKFLRSASLYMLNSDMDVDEGDTADGPGETVWKAIECDEALSDPPRPTIRWIPDDGNVPPDELLDRGDVEEFDEDLLADELPDDALSDDDLLDDDILGEGDEDELGL